MPRKTTKQEKYLIEEQVIEAFTKTTRGERGYIADLWCKNYAVELGDFVKRTGLPRIALVIAALIDTDNPLLVSPGRGVMWSAIGCYVVVAAVQITEVPLRSPQLNALIAALAIDSADPAVIEVEDWPVKQKEIVHRA